MERVGTQKQQASTGSNTIPGGGGESRGTQHASIPQLMGDKEPPKRTPQAPTASIQTTTAGVAGTGKSNNSKQLAESARDTNPVSSTTTQESTHALSARQLCRVVVVPKHGQAPENIWVHALCLDPDLLILLQHQASAILSKRHQQLCVCVTCLAVDVLHLGTGEGASAMGAA